MADSICVHGLGQTGLPTAALFANNGFEVTGFDTDPQVISGLRDGDVPTEEPRLETFVERALESGRLTPAPDPVEADVHFICVPTPLDDENRPDLRFVRQAGDAVSAHLRRGDAVVLESTVPPGTTAGLLRDVLEASGLDAGEGFGLAHVPETVLPGNTVEELHANDRVVGGYDDASAAKARDLYEPLIDGDVYVAQNTAAAEFVKLVQNAYRDVNIALANEFAKLAGDHGIDARDALSLANTHPRVDVLDPGPGVGGHCIPIDPLFLCEGSPSCDLIGAARRVNDSMSAHLVEMLREEVGTLAEKRIAVLGIAYKGNVSDARNSPGLRFARTLQAQARTPLVTDGARRSPASARAGDPDVEARLHDPHVEDGTLDLVEFDEAVSGADAIVITTDHDEYERLDPTRVRGMMRGDVVLDARGIISRQRWSNAGFRVRQL